MPSEPRHAYQRIAGVLREAITAGRVAAGAKLSSERELAAQQKVSLMTARRAMVELERMGLVTRRVGAGTYVAPARRGQRSLRDPHEEFSAARCDLLPDGGRHWLDESGVVVVEERIVLTAEGTIGTRPLLEFLGAAAHGDERIWAEGDALRVEQKIYGVAEELLAVREMTVRGRRIESRLAV